MTHISYKNTKILWAMCKDSSAKYYQKNKERLQKRACERYQNLSKEERKKSDSNGRNNLSITYSLDSGNSILHLMPELT